MTKNTIVNIAICVLLSLCLFSCKDAKNTTSIILPKDKKEDTDPTKDLAPEIQLSSVLNLKEDINFVLLELNGAVATTIWDKENSMKVALNIRLEGGSEGQLKKLVDSGRYTIRPRKDENSLVLDMPYREKELQNVNEVISFEITIPDRIETNFSENREIEPLSE